MTQDVLRLRSFDLYSPSIRMKWFRIWFPQIRRDDLSQQLKVPWSTQQLQSGADDKKLRHTFVDADDKKLRHTLVDELQENTGFQELMYTIPPSYKMWEVDDYKENLDFIINRTMLQPEPTNFLPVSDRRLLHFMILLLPNIDIRHIDIYNLQQSDLLLIRKSVLEAWKTHPLLRQYIQNCTPVTIASKTATPNLVYPRYLPFSQILAAYAAWPTKNKEINPRQSYYYLGHPYFHSNASFSEKE